MSLVRKSCTASAFKLTQLKHCVDSFVIAILSSSLFTTSILIINFFLTFLNANTFEKRPYTNIQQSHRTTSFITTPSSILPHLTTPVCLCSFV